MGLHGYSVEKALVRSGVKKDSFMEDIKISIIVPCYNASKYLRECLDSIKNQKYSNLEVICVDDGSSDESVEIIRSEYPNFILIQKDHSNAGDARNEGIAVASGKYLMFLDADDIFDENLVSTMVNKAEKENADICICSCRGLDDATGEIRNDIEKLKVTYVEGLTTFSPNEIASHLFQITPGWPWDRMFSRELIVESGVRFQSIALTNDAYFVNMISTFANRITYIDECLVTHRMNISTSIEGRVSTNWKCSFEMFYAEKKYLDEHEIYNLYEKTFVNQVINYSNWAIERLVNTVDFEEYYGMLQTLLNDINIINLSEDVFHFPRLSGRMLRVAVMPAWDFLRSEIAKFSAEREELLKNVNNLFSINRRITKDFDMLNDIVKSKYWRLPSNVVPDGSKLVIYGFGDVGKDLAEQIYYDSRYEIIAVLDKNGNNCGETRFPIILPNELSEYSYDFIVIAVLNRNTQEEIYEMLKGLGISAEKIVREDFLKHSV